MRRAEDDEPPVAGYERLGARDAMRVLRDLPRATLERLYTFEDLHLRRTSVLKAIKRAIDRTAPTERARRTGAVKT